MSEYLEMVGAWLEVGRMLAKKVGMSLDDLQIDDAWRAARGLRVAYRVQVGFGEYSEERQESLSVPPELADAAVRRMNP